GAFWVVNPGRHGLEQYRADGALVSAWYNPSMKVEGFCGCCNPSHVAFMSDGALVTAEKGITRVKIYAVDQTMDGVVAGPDAFHDGPTGPFSDDLEMPIKDLAVDTEGRVLVLDGKRNTIRVFVRKEPA
ncbi:MAG: hypothetical protein GY851_32930, partial [bacterium]|nr:hypothetical protein [bacterium]